MGRDPAGSRDSEHGTDPTCHESADGVKAPDKCLMHSASSVNAGMLRRISAEPRMSGDVGTHNLLLPKRQRLYNEHSDTWSEASSVGLLTFDPSLNKEDKEEFKFEAPDPVNFYLEKHFRQSLFKEERTAMLRKHPKPTL